MKKIIFVIFVFLVGIQAKRWFYNIALGDVGYISGIIIDQRRYCAGYFPHYICLLFYNKPFFYLTLLLKNYVTSISLNYLFLQRSSYVWELPLFLAGAYFLVRRKTNWVKYALFYLLLYPFLGPIFSFDWPTNYWIIKPMLVLIEIYGLINLIKLITLWKRI